MSNKSIETQALYDEFESFLEKYCGLETDESSKYKRQKLGHYFDVRDEYFKLWLNARNFYGEKNRCKCSRVKGEGYQPEAKPEYVLPPPLVRLGPPKKP